MVVVILANKLLITLNCIQVENKPSGGKPKKTFMMEFFGSPVEKTK